MTATTIDRPAKAMTDEEAAVRDVARRAGYQLTKVSRGGAVHFKVASTTDNDNPLGPWFTSCEHLTLEQAERFVRTVPVELACKMHTERHALKVQLSDQVLAAHALWMALTKVEIPDLDLAAILAAAEVTE